MKRIISNRTLLSIGMFFVMGWAMSQKLAVSTYVENTHISPKAGVFIGLKDRYLYEYGFFYQQAAVMHSVLMSAEEQQALPRFYEREFLGVYFGAPVFFEGNFSVGMNVRTGVSNGENFVITPSILAEYNVFENLSLKAGVGTRCFRPTYQYGLSISF